METYEINACVRGQHVFREVWSPVEGEELECEREPGNSSDPYAVAVMKGNIVVGHVPRVMSSACSLFLEKPGYYFLCHSCLKKVLS